MGPCLIRAIAARGAGLLIYPEKPRQLAARDAKEHVPIECRAGRGFVLINDLLEVASLEVGVIFLKLSTAPGYEDVPAAQRFRPWPDSAWITQMIMQIEQQHREPGWLDQCLHLSDAAEEVLKAYEMSEAPRYELAKELGAERPFLLPAPAATIKEQDSLRTKGVLALQKLVAEQMGEIPAETLASTRSVLWRAPPNQEVK